MLKEKFKVVLRCYRSLNKFVGVLPYWAIDFKQPKYDWKLETNTFEPPHMDSAVPPPARPWPY